MVTDAMVPVIGHQSSGQSWSIPPSCPSMNRTSKQCCYLMFFCLWGPGGRGPGSPAPRGQQCRLSHHQLLLPGAATASILSTPHPPWKPIETQANPQFLPLRSTDANVNIFTQCELLICSASSGLSCAVACTWRSCSVWMVQLFVFFPLPCSFEQC